MENWGLVTYRESCVLVDPANTSSASKQWVAIVVDHEMAHQWFGNLVTMEVHLQTEHHCGHIQHVATLSRFHALDDLTSFSFQWWTHLWLNEGFASFMENECTNALFPEFDIW